MVSRPWSAKAPDAEIAIVMSDQTCLTLSDLPRSLRMKAAIVLRRCLLVVAFLVPVAARAQVDESRTLAFQGVERRYFHHQPPTAAAPGSRRSSSPCTG